MRALQNRNRGIRERWIQRVAQQIVVKDVLVAPEIGVEVVQRSFEHPQVADVVWIAAIAVVAEGKIVEQQSFVRGRMQIERILQQPGAAAEIHERVPDSGIAGEVGDASAKFCRLLDLVTAGRRSRSFGVRCCRQIGGLARGIDLRAGRDRLGLIHILIFVFFGFVGGRLRQHG